MKNFIQNDLIARAEPVQRDFIARKQTRSQMGFVPGTLDEKTRSVEVVAATQTPSEVYDPNRWENVIEVLLMTGVRIPDSGQIPVTVEHYRSAEMVIGSFREMRVEGEELVGRVYFASSQDAEDYWIKVKEGHLDRFSITYPASDRDSVYVAENESTEIEGKRYDGPMLITKKWTPKALGLVIFGADENAKARNQNNQPPRKKENIMDPKLRAFLERSGLNKDATEQEAWAFLDRMEVKPAAPAKPAEKKPADPPDPDKIRAEAAAAERKRVTEITSMCARFDCSDLAETLITDGTALDLARQQILDRVAARDDETNLNHRPPATVQADERDKFRSAAMDSLLIRSGITPENPAAGADDLTGYSLREIARHCLQLAGQPVGGHPLEMVGRAMTTSDFPYILANVANKNLFHGWETAEETWDEWCGTGSVTDFKTNYAPRVSEASDLDEIPEHGEYKYGKRTEAQESYSIATYGKLFALARQTIINDDLNALTDIPRAHGEAAARVVGDVAYAVLTGNSAMGDGTALFHADHNNLVASGSGAAPGVETIAAGVLAMGTQKDLQGLRSLNIRPRYFLAPKALEGTSEVFFRSGNFADSDTVATDSSLAATRANPYAGKYLTRVYDARLDDDDAAKWYLAAAKGKTVIIFFLNGIQKPYLETKQGWTVDGVEYKVRIDVGAKAMDWRGLYMNDGN